MRRTAAWGFQQGRQLFRLRSAPRDTDDRAGVLPMLPRLAALGFQGDLLGDSGFKGAPFAAAALEHAIHVSISAGGMLDGLKGSYNAHQYYDAAADTVEAALRRALGSLGSGMVFRNVSSLAAHVAPTCERKAGQLRRNRRYRAILEEHMARQPGTAGIFGDETRSVPVLRAKLAEATPRISNLERDRKRLEAFVARHLSGAQVPSPAGGKSAAERAPDFRRAFECTAAALEAVIRHAEVYEVDLPSGALMDRGARPGSPKRAISARMAGVVRALGWICSMAHLPPGFETPRCSKR